MRSLPGEIKIATHGKKRHGLPRNGKDWLLAGEGPCSTGGVGQSWNTDINGTGDLSHSPTALKRGSNHMDHVQTGFPAPVKALLSWRRVQEREECKHDVAGVHGSPFSFSML